MIAHLPVKSPLLALALHTAGWPCRPEVTHHPDVGKKFLTYWVDHDPAGAQAVLMGFQERERPQENLQRRDPTHRFLAARAGIEAYGVLEQWVSGRAGTQTPAVMATHGPLRVLAAAAPTPAHDLMRHVWREGARPVRLVPELCFAAALAVCGVPFWPELVPAGQGKPVRLAFGAESLTFPGLTVTVLEQYLGVAQAVRYEPLPGMWPLGEHPFDYAYQGAVNASTHGMFLARSAKVNPQVFLKGPGTGGVIASQSLFEESNRNSAFRDRAQEFLAGEG